MFERGVPSVVVVGVDEVSPAVLQWMLDRCVCVESSQIKAGGSDAAAPLVHIFSFVVPCAMWVVSPSSSQVAASTPPAEERKHIQAWSTPPRNVTSMPVGRSVGVATKDTSVVSVSR